MAAVRLIVKETRTTTVTFDVDDANVADPAMSVRVPFLRAMLAQPPDAVLAGRAVDWSTAFQKVASVECDYDGTTYAEYAR